MKRLLIALLSLGTLSALANNSCSYQFESQDIVGGCAGIQMDTAFNLVENKLERKGYSYLPLNDGDANYTISIDYVCINYTGGALGVPSRAIVTLIDNSDDSKVTIEKGAFGPGGDRRSLKKALRKISKCD